MHALLAIALAAGVAAGDTAKDPQFAHRDAGPDRLDVSDYPPDQQQRYPLFTSKCSRCHTLARPINTRFDAARWKRYAKKMIRRPNSGINEEQAQELFEFLKYYATRTADR